MSLLSTKGVYGLMCAVEISRGDATYPVSLATLAQDVGVSKNYLEQLLNAMRRAGLVESVKGAKGGYYLAKNASEITFYDVLVALETQLCLTAAPAAKKGAFGAFFADYDEKIKALFSRPLSDFSVYENEAKQYLNYVI